jgi:hypothetical protein
VDAVAGFGIHPDGRQVSRRRRVEVLAGAMPRSLRTNRNLGALGAQIVADGVVFTNPRWDAQGPTLIRQRSGSRSDDGALAERERPTRFQELFDMLV